MKKFLSLALALAMTLSLVVVGASATEYDKLTDKASIQHSEAVAVMNKLGIISGYSDGSFKPAASITRGAAAKIICMTKLGVSTANTLSSETAPFKDVSTANTFAAFIAYCSNTKVVNGYNDGSFRPSESVTGYAFAKMLLTALGITGTYTGNGWEINVATAAQKAKLFKGIDTTKVVMSKALSRDNACQMALNALNYSATGSTVYRVSVTTAKTVDAGGAQTAANDPIPYDFTSSSEALSFYAAMKAQVKTTGIAVNDITAVSYAKTTGNGTDTLLKSVFEVTRATGSFDKFGRPATTYTADDSTWKLTFNATPVATYTGTVSAAELYSKLGYAAVIKGAASSTSTVGNAKANGYVMNANLGTAVTADLAVAANKAAMGGTGIVTEIYATSTDDEYIAVQVRPALAQVTNIVKTAATTTKGAYTTYTIGGVDCNVYTSVVNPSNDVNNVTINGTIAKNDWVIISGNTAAGYTVTPAKLVTGKLTGYSSSADAYTIEGTAYAKSAADAKNGATTTLNVYNSTNTYALDTYGNVVAQVTVTTPTNYLFVLKGDVAQYLNTTTNKVVDTAEATSITTDGKLTTVKVAKVGEVAELVKTDMDAVKGLYSYTVNTDGTYNLTAAAVTVAKAVTQIEKGNVTLANGLYADSNTKFYQAVQNTSKVYTGVTAYTGYANVASLTLPVNVKALDSNDDGVAEIVFVDSTTLAGATTSYIFVTGSFTSDGANRTYDVIENGVASKMVLTGVGDAGLYTVKDGVATAVSSNDTDLKFAVASPATAGNDGIYNGATSHYFTYENGLLKHSTTAGGTYTTVAGVAATTPVYTLANGACTASTAADLSAANGTQIVIALNAAQTAISAIYIVK